MPGHCLCHRQWGGAFPPSRSVDWPAALHGRVRKAQAVGQATSVTGPDTDHPQYRPSDGPLARPTLDPAQHVPATGGQHHWSDNFQTEAGLRASPWTYAVGEGKPEESPGRHPVPDISVAAATDPVRVHDEAAAKRPGESRTYVSSLNENRSILLRSICS